MCLSDEFSEEARRILKILHTHIPFVVDHLYAVAYDLAETEYRLRGNPNSHKAEFNDYLCRTLITIVRDQSPVSMENIPHTKQLAHQILDAGFCT